MEVTYAVIVKKEYQDLVTTLSNDKFEVVNVFDNIDDANVLLSEQEGIMLSNLNKIDTNGILLSYQTKILPLEGKYDIIQVQSIVNALQNKIFNNQTKAL